MYRSVLSLIALLAALSGAAPAWAGMAPLPRGIKGADDRQPVESLDWPWRAIGRINRETGGFCSGTVIGKGRVLTVAHCLWNPRTGHWLRPHSVHFLAGYKRGSYVAHSRVRAFHIAPGYEPEKGHRGTRNDWAILALETDLSAKTGVIPVESPTAASLRHDFAAGGVLINAGYAQDKSHILMRHVGCHITVFSPRQMLFNHDCDATRGDSGAPFLLRVGKRYRLIGIHVGTVIRNGKAIGVAVSSGSFIAMVSRLDD